MASYSIVLCIHRCVEVSRSIILSAIAPVYQDSEGGASTSGEDAVVEPSILEAGLARDMSPEQQVVWGEQDPHMLVDEHPGSPVPAAPVDIASYAVILLRQCRGSIPAFRIGQDMLMFMIPSPRSSGLTWVACGCVSVRLY